MGAALPQPQVDKAAGAVAAASAVVVVRGLRALAEIVPAWEDLAAHALEPNPFHEPWILLPALERFAAEDARLLTVWASGKLAFALPVRCARLPAPFPGSVFATWRHRHSMLGTPLVRAGPVGATALRALLGWLSRRAHEASGLELDELPCGGPFHAALVEALNAAGLAAVATHTYSRALLRRDADADAYLSSALSRHTRRRLERKEAELRRLGVLTYRSLQRDEDAEPWIEQFLSLEASGWKGRAGSAMACSEANRSFAREIMREAHRRARLMMTGIDFEGRPIARLWCFLAGDGSYGFKTAYDESFKPYMPGILAEVHNVRELHARPGLQWQDSYTAPGNTTMDSLWKHRLVMQSLLVGARGWGALAAGALPLARWAKRVARRGLAAQNEE